MKNLGLAGLILVLCLSCQNRTEQEAGEAAFARDLGGTIRISGAYAIYPLLAVWADEFQKMHPEVTIDLMKNGTGKGLQETISKRADLAMVSRDLTPEEDEKGYWKAAVAKEAVVPIFASANPYHDLIMKNGLNHRQLQYLFTSGSPGTWGELFGQGSKEPVNVFIREDLSGAAEIWSRFLMIPYDSLKGTGVVGDDEMLERVSQNPLGLGFCNMNYAYNVKENVLKPEISIMPIDLNYNGKIDFIESIPDSLAEVNRFIMMGRYPSALCRHLYLVAVSKPTDPNLVAFLNYIMTDGQKLVNNAGFCKVPGYVIECQKRQLNQP